MGVRKRLTKKDFDWVARILKEAQEDIAGGTPAEAMLLGMIEDFADYFTSQNPRFDPDRFFEACEPKN